MSSQPAPVPPDDLSRELAIARPDQDQSLPHIGLAGNTYTILVTGEDTAGKYTLIDMHVLPGGGPPPHRHDFEEMFTVLDGEVRVTFRDQTIIARAGETINIPANAPHAFTNTAGTPSRLLCLCAPAGQEKFFTLVGQPVATGRRHRPRSAPKPRQPRSPRRKNSPRSTRPNCSRPRHEMKGAVQLTEPWRLRSPMITETFGRPDDHEFPRYRPAPAHCDSWGGCAGRLHDHGNSAFYPHAESPPGKEFP